MITWAINVQLSSRSHLDPVLRVLNSNAIDISNAQVCGYVGVNRSGVEACAVINQSGFEIACYFLGIRGIKIVYVTYLS